MSEVEITTTVRASGTPVRRLGVHPSVRSA